MNIQSFVLHRQFVKQYRKLGQALKEAFKKRRDLLLVNPYHPLLNNHPLHGEWEGHRSINITGDLRAVFKVEGETAIFVAIDTHTNLYD